jgi:glycosyltransferase involved in cell wall biosynthesis
MSISDGYGLVVPQMMACALPLILSTQVGAADLISDRKNGFLVDVGDVAALKARLLELSKDPNLCLSVGQAAAQSVQECSWEAYGHRLETILHSVMSQHEPTKLTGKESIAHAIAR